MAIQERNGMIRGKAGSVIFRKWRSLNIVQGRPVYNKHKRTFAMRAAALEFGMASTTASSIRHALPQLYLYPDVEMPSRLVSKVLRCIQASPGKERLHRNMHDADLAELRGFEFNTNSLFSKVFPVKPQVDHTSPEVVKIHIPAFDRSRIAMPSRSDRLFLRILLIAFDFKEAYCEFMRWQDIPLEEGQNAARDIEIAMAVQPGLVAMVGMTLIGDWEARMGRVLQNSESWSPSCIVDAWHAPLGDQPRRLRKELQHVKFTDGRTYITIYYNPGNYDSQRYLAEEIAMSGLPKKKAPPGDDGYKEELPTGRKPLKWSGSRLS